MRLPATIALVGLALLGLLVVYDISMLLYDRFLFAALLIYANRIKPRMRFLHR